jgi:hypothetical protein
MPVAEKKQSLAQAYLGSYKKKILVLVAYPDEEWIIPKDKLFLGNVIKAIHADIDEIALINVSKAVSISTAELIESYSPNAIIGFDVQKEVDPSLKQDEVHQLSGAKVLYCSSGLGQLVMDKTLKARLWGNLQQMFNL